MKVWILMAGQYSDKHLIGVFSSEEKANEFKKRYDIKYEDYWDPFEHELDTLVQDDRLNYFVRMELETGNDAEASLSNNISTSEGPTVIPQRMKYIFNYILADSPEQAIKILNEQRIHYLQERNEK